MLSKDIMNCGDENSFLIILLDDNEIIEEDEKPFIQNVVNKSNKSHPSF